MRDEPVVRGTYDDNGNLLTRTDARGAVATMGYNARNQMVTKMYSGTAAGATPNVTYTYGGCTNGVDRLCSVSSSAAVTSYTYDVLGRVVGSSQTVPGYSPFTFAYSYNLGDSITEMTYPANGTQAGRKVGYDYYASGRVKLVRNGAQGSAARWVKENIAYWPNGTAKSMTLGNDVIETTGLDARLRVTERKATKASVNLMTLTVGYQMNGNVSQETRTSGATGQTMSATVSYGYDGVNRLGSANQSGTWSQSYGYDRRGNRWVSGTTGFVNVGLAPTAMAQFSAATNRLVQQQNGTALPGTPYDDAGNLVSHPALGTMTYDGENRLVTAVSVAAPPKSATYVYDGEGRRVKRTVGTDTTVYVYDAMGQLAAEVGSAAPGNGTQYLTGDHLGSTRLTTDSAGAITKCYDYLPFGEDLTIGRPSCFVPPGGYQVYPPVDKQSVKFTGKERDAETGLDYFGARYMSSAQGRFTSPDKPFADQNPLDPQSWNLYSYVRNNPLAHIDSDGQACTALNSGSGYCQRADLYANFDALVHSKTRFFAAASAATQAIANVDVFALGTAGTSSTTRAFLQNTGEALVAINTQAVGQIMSGQMSGSGPALDAKMVHMEQTAVQKGLDNLKRTDAKAYNAAIGELNGLLNSSSSAAANTLKALGGVSSQATRPMARSLRVSERAWDMTSTLLIRRIVRPSGTHS